MRLYGIGLGANLGDPSLTLRKALRRLGEKTTLERTSSLYANPAWGVTDQPDFVNAVLVTRFEGEPPALLELRLSIELEFGRRRLEKWGPRTLDLDVLFDS